MKISEFDSAVIRRNAFFPASLRRSQGRRLGNISANAVLAADHLETRTMLAAVYWDGEAGDFHWNNSLNWSSNTLPGPADDVFISEP